LPVQDDKEGEGEETQKVGPRNSLAKGEKKIKNS